MKKIFIFFTAIFMSVSCFAFDVTGRGDNATVGDIVNDLGLVHNHSYGVDVDQYGAKRISAVVTYSSVTYSNVTFSTNAYTAGSGNITITNHGLTTALPVSVAATAGTIPPPLTATDYWIIRVDANTIQLSSTSAKAQNLDYIIMGSSKPADGTQTYTITVPSTQVGTPSFKWQGTNNGTDLFDIAITSVTVSEYTYGGASVGFDFQYFDYSHLILNVISPTTGALKIRGIVTMKTGN